MKIRPVEAEFHGEGRMDRHDEAKSLFTILQMRLKGCRPLSTPASYSEGPTLKPGGRLS